MKSICCICGKNFDAKHSYGLCPLCLSKDRLREFDRIESAVKLAHKQGICPVSISLLEWLSVLSDFHGNCSLCKKYTANRILIFDRSQGLIYRNILPACAACETHFIHGFDTAKQEAASYLSEQALPKFVPSNEEEATQHVEYQ